MGGGTHSYTLAILCPLSDFSFLDLFPEINKETSISTMYADLDKDWPLPDPPSSNSSYPCGKHYLLRSILPSISNTGLFSLVLPHNFGGSSCLEIPLHRQLSHLIDSSKLLNMYKIALPPTELNFECPDLGKLFCCKHSPSLSFLSFFWGILQQDCGFPPPLQFPPFSWSRTLPF